MAKGAVNLLISLYQRVISPFLGPRCRFYPSCSEYMRQAVLEFGIFKGLMFGVRRLVKCHPWHPGGIDLVRSVHGE